MDFNLAPLLRVEMYQRMMIKYQAFVLLVSLLLYHLDVSSASPLPVKGLSSAKLKERLKTARKILKSSPLIDGHNKLPWFLQHHDPSAFNLTNGLVNDPSLRNTSRPKTTFQNLRQGLVATQLWFVQVPCKSQYLNSVQLLMEQLDLIKRILATYRRDTIVVRSAKEIKDNFGGKKISSLIGIEGGHALASSMGVIRSLYDLGVRSITLTHQCHTPWAKCSYEENDAHVKGLTVFGQKIIRELNRLGFIIDVSQSSPSTVLDVLNVTYAPLIFTHSGAKKLCDIHQNIPDEILERMSENGGLIMVSFAAELTACGSKPSIDHIIGHINYIREKAGIDHIGLGAGYDSGYNLPPELSDASKYPLLFAELLSNSKWSEEDLKKLAGGNFLRVLSRVEEVRDSMSSIEPSEEIIPYYDIDNLWPCRYKFASSEERS